MTRRAWIAVAGSLGLVVVLAVALVVAIASGGEDDPQPAVTPAQGGFQTFGGGPPPEVRECLSEHGVEQPHAGGPVPEDLDSEALQEALEECGVEAQVMPFSPGSGGGG